VGKLVYELEAIFDEQGRAEVRVPDIAPGCYHVELRIDDTGNMNGNAVNGSHEKVQEVPLVISEVGGKHFKWHAWEWTGVPPNKIWTRDDFYDDDE
jgi:hypothetical protein